MLWDHTSHLLNFYSYHVIGFLSSFEGLQNLYGATRVDSDAVSRNEEVVANLNLLLN